MSFRAVGTVFGKELKDVMRDRRTLIFMLVIPTLSIPVLMWLTTEQTVYFAEKLAKEQVNVLVLNPEAAPRLLSEVTRRSSAGGKVVELAKLLERKGLGAEALSLASGDDPAVFDRLLKKKGIDPEQLTGEIQQILGVDELDASSPKELLAYAFPPNFKLLTELVGGVGDPRDPRQRERVLLDAVRTERIAAAVGFAEDSVARLQRGDSAEVTVYFLESSDRSTMAKDGLQRIFKAAGATLLAERLSERGLPPGFAAPLKLRPVRLPGPGLLIKLMSQLLPYMIILFAFLGAMYPAIDLGAGEKERGTLETLLVAPVGRLSIMLGKFGVVLVAALVSAILATVSLAVSLKIGFLSTLALVSGGAFSFSISEALTAILLVVPVGCIFAALLLALSMFAKSFKEAQSYAGPLQTLIILPAFVSFLPGVKLDWATATLPIVNVTIALKEIFTGNIDQYWGQIGIIFLSTSVVAGLLLWFSAWWARREAVLFRS
jgi:sodium transport system permease protein